MLIWKVKPEWAGQTAFIVGGGMSVRSQPLERLRGHNVIVVNSSYEAAPWASFLFFADKRWWDFHLHKPLFENFKGRRVTCSGHTNADLKTLRLRRVVPNTEPQAGPIGPGLALPRDSVVSNRTSLQGAMNLAFHLGAKTLVLLGADAGRDENGNSHHHTEHKWKNKPGNETWDIQNVQLRLIAEPLREHGVKVLNTSPTSRIDWWPKCRLDEWL